MQLILERVTFECTFFVFGEEIIKIKEDNFRIKNLFSYLILYFIFKNYLNIYLDTPETH